MRAPSATELYTTFCGPVFRYLLRMTGIRGQAEELTQDVFVRIVRGLPAYDARGRDRAWVFGIAHRVLLNWRRGQARRPHLRSVGDADAPNRADPAARVVVGQALSRVAESDREVFLLRELGGLGYAEIGNTTGLTEAAVRSRIYRARQQLRDALRPHSAQSDTKEVRA